MTPGGRQTKTRAKKTLTGNFMFLRGGEKSAMSDAERKGRSSDSVSPGSILANKSDAPPAIRDPTALLV